MNNIIRRFIYLFFILEFSSPVYSQTGSNGGKGILYKYVNQTLGYIIEDIRQKTGVNFIYMNDLLDDAPITCDIDSVQSEISLATILKEHNIAVTRFPDNSCVLSKHIYLKPEIKKKEPPVLVQQVVNWTEPVLINRNNILYPILAMNNNIEGEVKLKVLINYKGVASNVKIIKSSGSAILDSATVDLVKSKEFIPAYANDKAVNVWTSLTFKYNLKTSD